MTEQQISINAVQYFNSFGRLFGEAPVLETPEAGEVILTKIKDTIRNAAHKYSGDPALSRIIDMDVLDVMEAVLNSQK